MTRLLACLLLVACAGSHTWRSVERDMGPPVARGTARALAQQRGGGHTLDGLVAETPAQLVDLWRALGLTKPIPAVDFDHDVVLGINYFGGVCEPDIVGVRKHANGYVTFEELHHHRRCILLGLMIVRVVAVPRAVVGEHFTWKHDGRAFAFELGSRAQAATHGRDTLTANRGEVELPRAMCFAAASSGSRRHNRTTPAAKTRRRIAMFSPFIRAGYARPLTNRA